MTNKKPELADTTGFSKGPGYRNNRDPEWERIIEEKASSNWMQPLTRILNKLLGFLWPLCHRYNYYALFAANFRTTPTQSVREFGVVITPAILFYIVLIPNVAMASFFSLDSAGSFVEIVIIIIMCGVLFCVFWLGFGWRCQNTHNLGHSLSYKLFRAGLSDTAIVRHSYPFVSCLPTQHECRAYARMPSGDIIIYFFEKIADQNPLRGWTISDIKEGRVETLEAVSRDGSKESSTITIKRMVIPGESLPKSAWYNYFTDPSFRDLLPERTNNGSDFINKF